MIPGPVLDAILDLIQQVSLDYASDADDFEKGRAMRTLAAAVVKVDPGLKLALQEAVVCGIEAAAANEGCEPRDYEPCTRLDLF